jgi:4-diphosphocytidyl-2-C-methyl-D-erythritol kinase
MTQGHDAASRLRVRVPAKINLHIGVGPRRDDGYHELVSVMQTVSLHDTLRLRSSELGPAAHPSARRLMCLALTLDDESRSHGADALPLDEDNLVVRAARSLMDEIGIGVGRTIVVDPADGSDHDEAPCTHLHLTKRIPIAAGMAGGSADAAAALIGLNALWDLGIEQERLRELAAGLGSDIPFCVVGGTVLATGTGTAIARVLTRGTSHWVIGMDDVPLSTPAVYAAFDELDTPRATEPDLVLQALRTGDVAMLAAALHNDLEPAAIALRPQLADRRSAMLEAGALAAIVSGSGPTLLGLASDALHAHALAESLRSTFPRVEVASSPAGGPEISVG